MSKVFSVVELENNSRAMESIYMPGIADAEEIEALEEFEELSALTEDGEHIMAKITAYSFGEGESVNANEEELKYFKENFDTLLHNDELDFLCSDSYSFTVEKEEWEEEIEM